MAPCGSSSCAARTVPESDATISLDAIYTTVEVLAPPKKTATDQSNGQELFLPHEEHELKLAIQARRARDRSGFMGSKGWIRVGLMPGSTLAGSAHYTPTYEWELGAG